MKKINILGTEYTVVMATAEERPKLKNSDGYMDFSTKEVVVLKLEPDERTVENLPEYTRKVLRHEITHAFFYESGLWCESGTAESWATDETITDWFAIQSPKIFEAFKVADCL